MWVKICGVRRRADALLAARLGADAVGVLVGQEHPSDDFLPAAEAAAILRALPPGVSGVLVSHRRRAEALLALIDQVRPAAVQLHGAIPPGEVRRLRRAAPGMRLIKAVHIGRDDPLAAIAPYLALVDAVVADSSNPATGQVGGTGRVHDWALTAALVRRLPLPLLLAGGLTPANVGGAIARVRPWGVDVNSGVRGADGGKDPALLAGFITAARDAAGQDAAGSADAG